MYVLEFDVSINNYSYKTFKKKRLSKYQANQKKYFKSKQSKN